jgi:hypothetical protein
MCLICDHLSKGMLTVPEAFANLNEMYEKLGDEHSQVVVDKLWDMLMDDDYDGEVPWEKMFDTWSNI